MNALVSPGPKARQNCQPALCASILSVGPTATSRQCIPVLVYEIPNSRVEHGATFFFNPKTFFSTLTFFFNPATFLFHPRTLFFDPVTFFFNPCTCFFDPGPFFFNPVHLGPPDFPAARSASFTLDGSSSSRLPAYKLRAVGGPIWGLQWSG